MIWKLVSREYHCSPYRITPQVRGWSVWLDGAELKRIGMGIEFLNDAKALAKKHSQEPR